MNPAEQNDDVVLTEDHLSRLQLQIAQRADELAQSRRGDRNWQTDLSCWLEAEREILGDSRATELIGT